MTTTANRFTPKCTHPGCSAWASWGYGCSKEIGSGTWYCFAHRPSDEMPNGAVLVSDAMPNAGPPDAMPDAMPAVLPGSGQQKRLL